MSRVTLILFSLAFLASGCKDDSITTYRLAKDTSPASSIPSGDSMPDANRAMMPGMVSAAPPPNVHWTTPAGWIEQAPSAMRIGSFLIKGPNEQTADVSVIPLSGQAGGDLANINRWRGQINLQPITEKNLPGQSEMLPLGGHRMRVVDFVSAEPLIDGRYKKRLLAAICTRGETSFFFKILGEDRTVEWARPAFLQFLRSVKFRENG